MNRLPKNPPEGMSAIYRFVRRGRTIYVGQTRNFAHRMNSRLYWREISRLETVAFVPLSIVLLLERDLIRALARRGEPLLNHVHAVSVRYNNPRKMYRRCRLNPRKDKVILQRWARVATAHYLKTGSAV